ncbi:RNA polymerase-associated protein rtf1 [Kickxella alabastrina]|uniref:RNA polymerase-associated protein rtf1 n=1 Tax=Kickxella alabastrina TaxID=61397 RepID=A0ACC1IUC6_9FUNG|nr:RNA polymerase-associated protein rtf1 [Kickxella alabastrina]
MDNLENDILELFEDDNTGSATTRSRTETRNKTHKRRRAPTNRRSSYSGTTSDSSVDMDTDDTGVGSDTDALDDWADDLMGDQKDRRWLASLNEVERERILAERQERRDVLNEQRELRAKLKAGVRVSDRKKPAGAFSDLKRAREHRRRGGSSEHRWSSGSDEEEAAEAAALDEINSICMTRNQLEQWLFRPFLKEAITGGFVRIVTRTRDSSGEYNQYKMMQIIDVVQAEGREQPPYHLNKTLTDTYLTLRFGAADKDYSMETISNSPIKPEELHAWDAALRSTRVRAQITPEAVRRKLADLARAREYKLTEAEITHMVNERARLRRIESGGALVNVSLERTRLIQQITDARNGEDWGLLKALEARLVDVEKVSAQRGESAGPTMASAQKPLLAPGATKHAAGEARGAMAAGRKATLAPVAAGSFRIVPQMKGPELVLKPKPTPGYAELMADVGGYDMSFIES